ncbi:unnamed protein product [Urochloa humidicola]
MHEYMQKKNQDAEPAELNEDGLQDDQVHDDVDGQINAVEAFRVCHTSRSRGMSEVAKEAVASMENMMAQPEDEAPPLTTAEVVSKALSQNSSTSTTFLKNAGIPKMARSISEELLRQ